MSEGQFWFVMICLMIACDLMVWRERRRLDRQAREYWIERDRASQERHEEFMVAIRVKPATPSEREGGGGK